MDYFTNQLEVELKKSSWDGVYSYIEFLFSNLSDYEKPAFSQKINIILVEEGAQYRFEEGQIVSLMTQIEVDETVKAQNVKSNASTHINKAIELFNIRPNPDYSNSIKESISAVEAIAREITGNDSATLSDAVKKLNLHPALQLGIEKIYAWTSDEGGIRHAVKSDDIEHGEAEARYMLVLCSSLVNFMNEKK